MRRNSRAMKAESFTFSSWLLPTNAFRSSRSSPAQNALPAPVMISTCASDFSISSSARSNSSTNSKLMALRLSGRLSVMSARPLSLASNNVLKFMLLFLHPEAKPREPYVNPSSFRRDTSLRPEHLVQSHSSNLTRTLQQSRQRFLNRRLNRALRQRFQQNFGRNISHQLVLGKRTSSQPAQRRVKSPAPGIVCRQNFFRRLLPPAVQVYADFSRRAKFGNHRLHQVGDLRRVRKSDGISEGNSFNAHLNNIARALNDLFFIPQVAIRIAKGHGDINHQAESSFLRSLLDCLQHLQRLFQCLVLILFQKSWRKRVGKPQRADRFGGDGALGALVVHHNADDLHIVRRVELLQHFFRIRHLRHRFGRYERHCVNVLESRCDQPAQIRNFGCSWNLLLQSLPGITRAFDEL